MTGAGLAIREDSRIDADVQIKPSSWTVSSIHADLFESDRLQAALLSAIGDLSADRTRVEFTQLLEDLGVDALKGAYADRVVGVARGDLEASSRLMEYTRDLGTGHSSLGPGFSSPTEDVRRGALPLLRESDVTPTVAVVIDSTFTDSGETPADQRDAVLSFLVDLARSCDVSLIAESQINRTFLYNFHREQLPPSVRNECNPRRESGPLSEIIDAAVTTLDPDGRDVRVLRVGHG